MTSLPNHSATRATRRAGRRLGAPSRATAHSQVNRATYRAMNHSDHLFLLRACIKLCEGIAHAAQDLVRLANAVEIGRSQKHAPARKCVKRRCSRGTAEGRPFDREIGLRLKAVTP